MAKMLRRDLTELDSALLANLTLQPGWPIVKAMLEEMCEIATSAVIQLDPSADNYLTKLKALQVQARVTNDVCGSILRSVETHIFSHIENQEQQTAVDTIVSKVRLGQIGT